MADSTGRPRLPGEGVDDLPIVIPGCVTEDDRGSLLHFGTLQIDRFVRMYVVRSGRSGVIRGWHVSREQSKLFVPLIGESVLALFALPDPNEFPADPVIQRIPLTVEDPAAVLVLAGYAHALQSIAAETAVLVLADVAVASTLSDEVRFPPVQWAVVAPT